MNDKFKIYEVLKQHGLSAGQDERIRAELHDNRLHTIAGGSTRPGNNKTVGEGPATIYQFCDLIHLQAIAAMRGTYSATVRSIDELLERDRLREKDGFPRKINVGRLIKPSKGGKAKVVIVPTTVEEKLIHDPSFKTTEKGEGDSSGGVGEGEEGEVIGEQPVRSPDGEGAGPGEGEGGGHELESDAYDLGKILTDAIHASPPCPRFSQLTRLRGKPSNHPDLIDPTRKLLVASCRSWVIENVEGAPLKVDLMLCGTMFNIRFPKHRIFEFSFDWFPLLPPCNHVGLYDPYHGGEDSIDERGKLCQLYGIDWFMTRQEVRNCIPPAYTEFIGRQLMAVLEGI